MSNRAVRVHPTGDPDARLLVQFDGRRLLDRDGKLLAKLAGNGRWYTEQGTLALGLTTPDRARSAEIIEKDTGWLAEAVSIITRLAETQPYLTSEDVWARVQAKPSESRMMGNALAQAQQAGVIARTSEHQPSTRRESHGRPILIWKSLRHAQQSL